MRRSSLMLAAAGFLFTAGAHAETVHFEAMLSGASEVPPTSSQGSGTATATLDTTSRKLNYDVAWHGLSGPAIAAHFHGPAAPGQNAPVALGLGTNPTSPIKGSAILTSQQVSELMGGKWYVNVHTAKYPGGEIRGQMARGR